MMKRVLFAWLMTSSLYCLANHKDFNTQSSRQTVYPYIEGGISTVSVFPYSGNIGVGLRGTKPYRPINWDLSINYDPSPIAQSGNIKGFLPLYFDRHEMTNSWYIGPFTSIVYQKKLHHAFSDKEFKTGFFTKHGISIGKQINGSKSLSFMQLSSNIAQWEIAHPKLTFTPWFTLTLQYGKSF